MASSTSYRVKRALMIAINNYKTSPLSYCVQDCDDLDATLFATGFLVTHEDNCNLVEFHHAIDGFVGTIEPDDLVLFYFAGHGKASEDRNYLLPADYNFDEERSWHGFITCHAVSLEHLMNKFQERRPYASIYILDCCRTNLEIHTSRRERSLSIVEGPPETLIVYACGSGQSALDQTRNGRNGVFMETLLEHIKKKDQHFPTVVENMVQKFAQRTNRYQRITRTNNISNEIILMHSENTISENTYQPIVPQHSTQNASNYHYQRPSSVLLQDILEEIEDQTEPRRKRPVLIPNVNGHLSPPRTSKHSTNDEPVIVGSNATRSTNNRQLEDRRNRRTNQPSSVSHGATPRPNRTAAVRDIQSKPKSSIEAKNSRSTDYEEDFEENKDNSSDDESVAYFASWEWSDELFDDEDSSNNEEPRQIKVNIQTLDTMYTIAIPYNATIRQLRYHLWNELESHKKTKSCTRKSHILLLFNHRMHIFYSSKFEKELVSTFLALQPTPWEVFESNANHPDPDFFAYTIDRRLATHIYGYETKFEEILTNSRWWQPRHGKSQSDTAQSTLLSSLYTLCKYFRSPPKYDRDDRRDLKIRLINNMRTHGFRPSVLALRHLLEERLFFYEKHLLMNSLLQLLSKRFGASVQEDHLGTFTPHLICTLFEDTTGSSFDNDGCNTFSIPCSDKTGERPYDTNPVSRSTSAGYQSRFDRNGEEEYFTSKKDIDLASLINHLEIFTDKDKRLKNRFHSFTIDNSPVKPVSEVPLLCEAEINSLQENILHKYQSFSLLTRALVDQAMQSHIRIQRNQLILLRGGQVCVYLPEKLRQISHNNMDYELTCFIPCKGRYNSKTLLKADDLFCIQSRQNDDELSILLKPIVCSKLPTTVLNSPIEQVTLFMLDISTSMLEKRQTDSGQQISQLDVSKLILKKASENLQKQARPNAIGLVLFGEYPEIQCPFTTNTIKFDHTVHTIPPSTQKWTYIYRAIEYGLHEIERYLLSQSHSPKCRKLIICITDGIDNSAKSRKEIKILENQVRKMKIIIDLVSFREGQRGSNEIEINKKINELAWFCENTGGILYKNESVDPLQLEAKFHQDAVLWLNSRETTQRQFTGAVMRIDGPSRTIPDKFWDVSIRAQTKINFTHRAISRMRRQERIEYEVHQLVQPHSNLIDFIYIYVRQPRGEQPDYTFWKVILKGTHPPYDGYYWLLYVEFPDDYPKQGPTIIFHTEIFHLNVSADGCIDLDLVKNNWSEDVSLVNVFQALLKLMRKPDIEHTSSSVKLSLYQTNREKYDLKALQMKREKAFSDIEKLKSRFDLKEE